MVQYDSILYCYGDTVRVKLILEVSGTHYLVVRRRMVLREVIGPVVFAGLPDELDLVACYAIFKPVITHVPRL